MAKPPGKMDPQRVKKFREVLQEVREYVKSDNKMSPEEELELFDRVIENWYEPLCWHYNLLAPNNEPQHITNQWQYAEKQKPGTIQLLIALPGMYFQIDKTKLYMNRVMYNEGRYGEMPPENFE